MRSFRFRPTLQTLESRLTPAITVDVAGAALHTLVNSAFISFGDGSHDWMSQSSLRFQLQDTTQTIFEQSDAAIKVFGQAQDEWQTEMASNPSRAPMLGALIMAAGELKSIAIANKSFAQSIANFQHFGLTLPVPPVVAPTIGPASPARSTVAVSPSAVAVGGTSTVTLTAIDAHGKHLTHGGSTVTFALGAGVGKGTFSTVTDNHNGTYTATFTGTVVGTNTITATLNTHAVTTTAPTISVLDDSGMTNTMPSPTDPAWVAGANGLKTWDVVVGTGTPVTAGQSIKVFYSGWLASNGTLFDSRRSPAAPADFSLTSLIQGWQQGVPGMKPGGIRRLFIPAALGYGAAGSPPNVPPNADLIFEIKLVSSH